MLPKMLRSIRPLVSFSFAMLLVLAADGVSGHAQTAVTQAAGAARAVPDRLSGTIDESARVTLHGTMHRLATKANDRGAVPDGMKLDRVQIVLKRSDAQEAALKQLIGDLHTPGTASYHKWLTPDDFGKQFGPSDGDVAKLESWLGSHGFSITKLNPGRQTLEIAGTAGQFRDTFHAEIHSYEVPSANAELQTAGGGKSAAAKTEIRYANASDPQIPAALAPVFGGFASLNNFRLKSHAKVLGKAEFNPVTHVTKPDWTTSNSDNSINLVVGPGELAVQYDLNPLYTAGTKGDGQSIAIVNESNIDIYLVNEFRALFGLPANPPQVIIDGNDPGVDGINSPYGPNYASGEAYLDVEISGAVAPDATVYLVIADDTALESGLTLAMERAVYSNVAPVISLSFGGCEADDGTFNTFISSLWEQAAAQGITVTVSTGDSGSAGCDDPDTQSYAVYGQAVSGTASTPYNVAVGGTDFYYSGGTSELSTYWNLTPSNATPTVSLLTKAPEQPWNDSQYGLNLYSVYNTDGETTIAGGSGGASTAGLPNSSGDYVLPYPKPSWQKGTGVPSDNARDIPDLSLFAANGLNDSYYATCAGDADCQTGGDAVQITGVGGTSASTPAFAGIMALVNQKYGRQGQADYVLYPLATQFPTAFNDVTAGTNTVPCATTTVYDSDNGNAAIAPKNCLAVSGGLVVTDPEFGSTTEGEIGLSGSAAYKAGTGYDLASGLGTVDAANLVNNWNKITFTGTTTTLTPSSTSFTHGTAITVSGTVTGGASGTPTGAVTLVTTSTEPNEQGPVSPVLNSTTDEFNPTIIPLTTSGSYSDSVNFLPGGTYNLEASYAGDGVNAASTSTPVQITVAPEASATKLSAYSISYTSAANTVIPSGSTFSYGAPVALSAQAGPATGAVTTNPTGTVTFLNGGTTIDTAVVNSEGDAESTAALPAGSYSITAKYSGDASYNASTSSASSFTVTKNAPIIYIYCSNSASENSCDPVAGQTTYLAVQVENSESVNGLALAPTGTVSITGAPSGTTPTSATLVPGVDPFGGGIDPFGYYAGAPEGTAYFAIPANISAPFTATVSYGGDANYGSASGSISTSGYYQTGTATTTTASATATATSPAALVTVTVTVSAASGPAPTGTVYLISSEAALNGSNGTVLPSSSGSSVTVTLPAFDSSSLVQGTNQITVQYIPASNSVFESSATEITIANPLSDFSLIPATTIVSVPATGSTPGVQTDVINLSSTNGFSGAVALTCSAPTGVSCSLSSTSATLAAGGTNSTTLTVNTTGVTKAGTYNVLVTGTDSTGEYIHTIGLQVVTPLISTTPGFTLSGPGVSIAAAGDTGTSTITVTPTDGFTGTVALTCAVTASPTGATGTPTCSLAPASVAISTAAVTSTLTIDTASTTTTGSYTVTVTGTSGSTTATTTVTVTVGGTTGTGTFTLAPNPATLTIATQGGSGTSTITVTPGSSGFTGTVALTCAVTASPSGASEIPTCLLSPSSVALAGATAVTPTLTIDTTAQTGKLELPMKGIFTMGGGAVLALIFLGVPVGRRGRRAVRAAKILSVAVLFAAIAGMASGCGSGGNSGGGGSSPSGGTTTGSYTITVTGTSGTVTETTTVAVTVN